MGLAEELQEAVNSLPGGDPVDVIPWTDEEMEAFLEDHPMVSVLVSEGFEPEEVIEALDAGMMQLVEKGKGPGKGGVGGNPGNDPFSTAPLHPTSSHGVGGGSSATKRTKPYTRTGECVNCSCSNGVCECTCNGKPRTIDMSSYYSSGRKAKYMAHWRKNHGPAHPR